MREGRRGALLPVPVSALILLFGSWGVEILLCGESRRLGTDTFLEGEEKCVTLTDARQQLSLLSLFL